MMRFMILRTLFLVGFALSGCTQVNDAFHTVQDAGLKQMESSSQANALISSGSCPPIEIVPDLTVVYDFINSQEPTPDTLRSKAKINNAHGTCSYGDKSVTVHMNVDFTALPGPQSTAYKGSQLTYPFFVAVTSPSGKILAKEVFSTDLRYSDTFNAYVNTEELKHIIPTDGKYDGGRSRIMVGFQMTKDQLNFNRELIQAQRIAQRQAQEAIAQAPNIPASVSVTAPDTSAPLLDANPLISDENIRVIDTPVITGPTQPLPEASKHPIDIRWK